jgi:RNA polymerase sigma factor (sigma-70 family)
MGDRQVSVKGGASGVSVDDLSRRYRGALLRYFARRRIDPQDAQDLAQEVFARLAKRDDLDDVGRVDGYLFATAANIARDFFRRRKVREDHAPESFYEAVHLDQEFSADRVLEGRQELACVIAALNEMPERMRNIVVLARLENLPRAEIAVRLGISKSLVEQEITLAAACLAERRKRMS